MEVKKGHWYLETGQAAVGYGSTMHARDAEGTVRTAEAWVWPMLPWPMMAIRTQDGRGMGAWGIWGKEVMGTSG